MVLSFEIEWVKQYHQWIDVNVLEILSTLLTLSRRIHRSPVVSSCKEQVLWGVDCPLLLPRINGTRDSQRSWWRRQMETLPRYWPFVGRNHLSPVVSPHKGQWRGALMFSLIWASTNGWTNNRDAGNLRRHRANYYATVMIYWFDLPNVTFRYRWRDQRNENDIAFL